MLISTLSILQNLILEKYFFEYFYQYSSYFEGQSWGWDGINRRQTAGGGYDEPSFTQGFTPIGKTYLQLFMHFFPMTWFSAVLLPQTSAGVVNSGTTPVTFGDSSASLAFIF